MARPNRSAERQLEAVSTLAATFAEQGYRRTTTAVLAERCGLTEVALYRLWPDKQAMFLAAIEHVGTNTERIWNAIAAAGGTGQAGQLSSHERFRRVAEVRTRPYVRFASRSCRRALPCS
jgi:AcrR family transcriptional regulator